MKKKVPPVSPYIAVSGKSIIDVGRIFGSIYGDAGQAATAAELAQVAHLDWVPTTLLEFARVRNGFSFRWEVGGDAQHAPDRGAVKVHPLEYICVDWKDVVYFDHEPAERQAQLRDFKIVDFFVDEACVGCYYRPERDEQLYYFDFEDLPQPLGVDFWGYLTLLPFTLGYRYWQYLLLDLYARPVGAGPFQPARSQTHQLVERLQAVVPSFDLAAFVAQYEAVRLPR